MQNTWTMYRTFIDVCVHAVIGYGLRLNVGSSNIYIYIYIIWRTMPEGMITRRAVPILREGQMRRLPPPEQDAPAQVTAASNAFLLKERVAETGSGPVEGEWSSGLLAELLQYHPRCTRRRQPQLYQE